MGLSCCQSIGIEAGGRELLQDFVGGTIGRLESADMVEVGALCAGKLWNGGGTLAQPFPTTNILVKNENWKRGSGYCSGDSCILRLCACGGWHVVLRSGNHAMAAKSRC